MTRPTRANPHAIVSAALTLAVVCVLLTSVRAMGQDATDASTAPAAGNTPLDLTNPISILDYAGSALPADAPSLARTLVNPVGGATGASDEAQANSSRRGFSTSLSIIILLTVLTLAPSILVMTTSFTRIVVVLSLLRQAIGTQSLPPSQVVVGMSLLLTLIVMAPTFDAIHRRAIVPLQNNQIDQLTAWGRAREPLREFMFSQIDHAGNWDDVYMILEYRGLDKPRGELTRGDVDMLCLVPAFVLSELKVAFLMGFRLYLPFLVIDMVVSSVLISMGMLMLPPVLVSLPFKLLLFVLVDGWRLVVGSLLHSFAVPGVTT